MKVLRTAFLYLKFCIILLWRKTVDGNAAFTILVTLNIGIIPLKWSSMVQRAWSATKPSSFSPGGHRGGGRGKKDQKRGSRTF
jgi:hypothetical protein